MNCNYVIDNSINDNKLNTMKSSKKIHQIKKLIKPLLALLKKNEKNNTYKKSPQPSFYNDEDCYSCTSSEIEDNNANERLENEIFEDIDSHCTEEEFNTCVPVFNDGSMDFMEVNRGQKFIPVNFARTQAGTFFWTSIVGNADNDIDNTGDSNPITHYQSAEKQVASISDRWAQA